MVFQSYALFPNMSVADNIGYGLKIRGVAERRARLRASPNWLRLTNIDGPREPPDRPALRRPAPARGAGARGGDPAGHSAARRAADRARCGLARPPARRAQSPVARARHHRDLRDARSVRGHGARRPHRGHEQGRDRADRHAARHLFHAAQPLRRRVHRRGEYRRSCRSRTANWCCPAGGSRSPSQIDLAAAVAMVRPESIRVVEAGSAPLSGTIDSVSLQSARSSAWS